MTVSVNGQRLRVISISATEPRMELSVSPNNLAGLRHVMVSGKVLPWSVNRRKFKAWIKSFAVMGKYSRSFRVAVVLEKDLSNA